MDFTELKSLMPNCFGCGRACPIDDLQCERGKDMINKLLSGEASIEDFRHEEPHNMPFHDGEKPDFPHGGPRNMPFHKGEKPDFPHDNPHNMPFRDGERPGFPHDNPHNMPFRPHEGGFGKSGPGRGPRRMPNMPPLPKDDSLESLLFFAAHAVRPRHTAGPGMAQTRILRLLNETGSISQQSLQEILAIRPGSLSELLGKLTQKGLIERNIDENDKRKNTLSLTEEGKDYISRVLPKSDPFDVLTEEEQESLKALLKKLLNDNAPKKPEEDELI